MSISPRASQTRLPLAESLSKHDQRPASTLVAWQFVALTASAAMPTGKDCALVDATSAAVSITLPAGSDEIIGLPFGCYKTDAGANAAGIVCAGSNTFADSTTSLTTTTQGAFVGATWDGTYWRPLVSVGATAASIAATTSVVVGGTGAGAAAAKLIVNKTAAGTGDVELKAANVLRGRLRLDASENVVLAVLDGSETEIGSITLNNSTGALTMSKGLTITTGGLTISAGSLVLNLAGVGNYADDAAAAVGGVVVGQPYRTGSALKIRAA